VIDLKFRNEHWGKRPNQSEISRLWSNESVEKVTSAVLHHGWAIQRTSDFYQSAQLTDIAKLQRVRRRGSICPDDEI
jgi:hypothetical protein